jgi:uncharacterized protein (DUF305 family)
VGTTLSGKVARWGAFAVAGVLLLAGCGGGSKDDQPTGEVETSYVQPGAPGEPSRTISAEDAAKLESPGHTRADVDFMNGMIHHHAQALVMTSLVPARSSSRDISLLARRMELSQETEIELMEKWLTDRGEEPPDAEDHKHDHGGAGGLMPGMVSSDNLSRLADSRGRGFDRRFLEYMTRHHQGALTMVNQLHADNGGLEPEIDAFTRHVVADQGIEIGRMEQLLAELEGRRDGSDVRRVPPPREQAEQMSRSAWAGGKPRICLIG